MITDFVTPGIESNYTFPPELKHQIAGYPDVHLIAELEALDDEAANPIGT